MKSKTFNYGKYQVEVSKDSKKVTILVNVNGRASDSIYDIPLPLMELIYSFIIPNIEVSSQVGMELDSKEEKT